MERLPSTYLAALNSLIDLYVAQRRPIKSKEIADKLGINEGTVRNVMITLKVMGYIDSKTGPYGGYVPTQKAFEYVKMPSSSMLALDIAPILINKSQTNLYVAGIELLDLLNPFTNRALVRVLGDTRGIRIGDNVKIGPTINSRVVIEGVITEKNDNLRELVVAINKLIAIPRIKVSEIMTQNIITVTPNTPLMIAAKIFAEKRIRAIPVVDNDGRAIGLISSGDLARAFVEKALDAKVGDYMRKEVPMINHDNDVYDAMRMMLIHNIGRLIVINVGRPVGIVTRTDILRYLAALD